MNVALRPERLDYISLCTGGAGLDLGVELAMPGARAVVCMEREAVAVARLATAMQEGLLASAPIWSDVRTFDGRAWRGLVDGLIGGIPCQPHSAAGEQLGEEDERDLWGPTRRIIVQARPWFVFIENVEGMLHTGGLERLCRNLLRLRFKIEVGLFSASECGASHQRNRIFVLAVADGESDLGWSELHARRAGGGRPGLAGSGNYLEHAAGERCREGEPEPVVRSGWDTAASTGCAVGHADDTGLEGRDGGSLRERSDQWVAWPPSNPLGDADPERQPQSQGIIGNQRRRTEHDGGTMADADLLEFRRESSARQLALNECDTGRSLFPPPPNDIDGWRFTLERWPELEPAVRRLAHGLVGRVDELRLLGNGVVPLQAAYALRTLATRLARRAANAGRLVCMMNLSVNIHERGES